MYNTELSDPHCGAVPLTANSAAGLLDNILRQVAGNCVVFDLDSTLLNNRPRNAKIMQEFGDMHNHSGFIAAHASHFINWDTRNSMALAGISAGDIDKHIDSYEHFWLERFFTSEYCQYDIDVAGAVDFVNAVHKGGGTVCYLTGRDETMRSGTHESLEKLGFPVAYDNAVSLVMKPTRGYSDDLFKREAMGRLRQQDGIFAAFDNEPTHINTYRQEFSQALCIHLFTDHSMRKVPLLDGIYSIQNFLK